MFEKESRLVVIGLTAALLEISGLTRGPPGRPAFTPPHMGPEWANRGLLLPLTPEKRQQIAVSGTLAPCAAIMWDLSTPFWPVNVKGPVKSGKGRFNPLLKNIHTGASGSVICVN